MPTEAQGERSPKAPDYSRIYFRSPKKAEAGVGVSDSWWYVGQSGMQVFVMVDGKTHFVGITKRQLRTLCQQMFGAKP
jgi:hypothetical protein